MMTFNITSEPSNMDSDHQDEADSLDIQMLIVRPSICGLGFVTNILSLLVFLQPSMRNLSCSVYLATKAISDFIFLVSVFIVWLTSVNIGVFNTPGICQLVVFASYLTAFVSIWLVVALTIENLLCVVKPWFVQRSCNARSAIAVTTMIIVLGVAFYHFALWNNGLRQVRRPVGEVYDVIKTNSSQFSNFGNDENITAPTESILIQRIFNTTGLSGSNLNTNLDSRSYVSKSTILVSDGTNSNNQAAEPRVASYQKQISRQEGTTESPEGLQTTNVTIIYEVSPAVCRAFEEFNHLAVAMTYLDSLMTLLVPLIILAITNAAIIVLALRASRRQLRREQQKPASSCGYHRPSGNYTSTSCANQESSDSEKTKQNNSRASRKKSSSVSRNGTITLSTHRRSTASLETQASRFLFSVSMTLLLFHIPSHVIRLKYLLYESSDLDVVLFRPFETLYHAHFAIGFFVYITFGTNFRRVFLKLIGKT
ncbi:somatostatin receptor type 4 [Plakobranchus ocellatus]|uniref:Somatostatin receptor type 4 n=1 Tax=Plakobranchus ocellatus TaxID=259542 RepID=A0AAV3Y921_9GAST|nr:somatostatin receptor type 4 [Plakobranchus ocellatus]